MEAVEATPRRRMGRPLSFDRATALRAAMLAFWRNGYETTSITDLTRAMKVTPPSIYTAFGDKRQLFLEAVQLYIGSEDGMEVTIAAAPSAYDAARMLLEHSATMFTGETTPPGCLLASATATGSESTADIRAFVTAIRSKGRTALRVKIEQEVASGKEIGDTDAKGLADLIFAVIQGMSVLARDGLSEAELLRVAHQFLSCWPVGLHRGEGSG